MIKNIIIGLLVVTTIVLGFYASIMKTEAERNRFNAVQAQQEAENQAVLAAQQAREAQEQAQIAMQEAQLQFERAEQALQALEKCKK